MAFGSAQNAWELANEAIRQLQRQTDHLARLIEAQEEQSQREWFTRRQASGQSDAAGAAVLQLPFNVGQGADLVSVAASGGAGGSLALYVGTTDPPNLIAVVPLNTGGLGSDMFADGEYIPQGSTILAVFAGPAAVTNVAVNLRVKVLSPEPMRQVA